MIKRTLKSLLHPPVWNYLRYCKYKFFNNGYFALNDLDKKMLKYLDYSNGYFIELGANDGFTQSNTLALENKKGWRGVLIEPSPDLFLSCCNFRAKDGNSIHCCACVPFEYEEKYVDIEYANLMSVSASLSTDIDDLDAFSNTGKSHLNEFATKLQFGARAMTLTSVLGPVSRPMKSILCHSMLKAQSLPYCQVWTLINIALNISLSSVEISIGSILISSNLDIGF